MRTETAATGPDLEEIVKSTLLLAEKCGANQAEVIVSQSRELGVSFRDGAVEDVESSESTDLGLRVMDGKRQAGVSTSDLSPATLETMVERAMAMARIAPEDPFCGLADADQVSHASRDLELLDPHEPQLPELIDAAKELESATMGVQGVNLPATTSAAWRYGRVLHMASNGLVRQSQASSHSRTAMALAGNDAGMERDWDYTSARWAEDLRPNAEIGVEAGKRAVARLGAQKVAGGALPVLFERRTAKSMLGMFLGAISGAQVARGVSFLKELSGEMVFSDAITISEDPFLRRGAGSSEIDAEGLLRSASNLVAAGRMGGWAHNLASARQLNESPNAHARVNLGGSPGIGFTNVVLQPGEKSPEQMIADMDEGLIITDSFGASFNNGTGDWSVGVAGFAVRGGERAEPVSEMTVAGNLKDIFKVLVPASDLRMESARETPSLLVPQLAVAGQ